MSANNWTVCPKCQVEYQTKVDALDKAYGKVSLVEYIDMVNEVKKPQPSSLREDWELGIWQGKFFVDYSAQCEDCGWSYEFGYKDENPTGLP